MAAVSAFAAVESPNIVGYWQKSMLSTDALTLITFNWLKVGGTSGSLNDIVKPSVAGTAYNHGENEDYTPGWEAYAPQIQVRSGSGYVLRYYADDMWSDSLCTEANNYDPDGDGIAGIAGWGTAEGAYDATTTVSVGGGFWMLHPGEDAHGKHTMFLSVAK